MHTHAHTYKEEYGLQILLSGIWRVEEGCSRHGNRVRKVCDNGYDKRYVYVGGCLWRAHAKMCPLEKHIWERERERDLEWLRALLSTAHTWQGSGR